MRQSRRWKACIYAGLGALVALVLIDIGSRLLMQGTVATATPQAPRGVDSPFSTGAKAPDFTLPDHTGKPHKLSEMVRRDTLLCFICGCANCIDLQTFTALMLQRLGTRAPDVIAVTTMPTDREETYFRDTGLKQRLLYERKEGPIQKQYRGHPCPRVFRLAPDRTFTWIGSSPGETGELRRIGLELAAQLGFSPEQAMALKDSEPAAPSLP